MLEKIFNRNFQLSFIKFTTLKSCISYENWFLAYFLKTKLELQNNLDHIF